VETNISELESKLNSVIVTEENWRKQQNTLTMTNMQFIDNTIIFNISFELKPEFTYSISIRLNQERYYDRNGQQYRFRSVAFQHYVPSDDNVSLAIQFGGLTVSLGKKCDAVQYIGLSCSYHKVNATQI